MSVLDLDPRKRGASDKPVTTPDTRTTHQVAPPRAGHGGSVGATRWVATVPFRLHAPVPSHGGGVAVASDTGPGVSGTAAPGTAVRAGAGNGVVGVGTAGAGGAVGAGVAVRGGAVAGTRVGAGVGGAVGGGVGAGVGAGVGEGVGAGVGGAVGAAVGAGDAVGVADRAGGGVGNAAPRTARARSSLANWPSRLVTPTV